MMLVFGGAGGSAAVDPEQYPTTAQFFQRLPDGIKENPLFVQVRDFLVRTNPHGQKRIDIEDVLWVLHELQADCQKMHDPTTITGCIMGSRDGVIPRVDFAATQQSARLLDREFITPLIESIYEQVYQWYGGTPHPKKLSVWTHLLNGLRAIDPVLEIFTTNYDIVLEHAIRQAGIPTEIGLTSYSEGNGVQTHLWDPANRPETGLLTKLHGSVDWRYLTEDVVVVRDAAFPAIITSTALCILVIKGSRSKSLSGCSMNISGESCRESMSRWSRPFSLGMPFAMPTSIPSSPI